LDPRNLNAGADLQLYERVPIQNEVPDSRKFKVPIQKNEVPIQNEVPDSRKIVVPIQKRRYRYGIAQGKGRYYTSQN
jgi:hypothetical protein